MSIQPFARRSDPLGFDPPASTKFLGAKARPTVLAPARRGNHRADGKPGSDDKPGEPDRNPVPSKDGDGEKRRPTLRTVRKKLDDLRAWMAYDRAICRAWKLGDSRGEEVISRDDLPEEFRAEFDPEFDDREQLMSDVWLYEKSAIKAIREHSGKPEGFVLFTDARDGMRWLVLPKGVCLLADEEAIEPGLEVTASSCRLIGFPAGHQGVIPPGWLGWDANPNLAIVVGEDGRPYLAP
jgi:hypothetical protein